MRFGAKPLRPGLAAVLLVACTGAASAQSWIEAENLLFFDTSALRNTPVLRSIPS
jgi:hypothetical protein